MRLRRDVVGRFLVGSIGLVGCGPVVGLSDSETGTSGTSGTSAPTPMASESGGVTTLPSMDSGTDVADGSSGRDTTAGGVDTGGRDDTGGIDTSGGVVGESGDTDPVSTTADPTGEGSSSDGSTDGGSSTGTAVQLCEEPPETTSCDAYAPDLDPFAAIGLGCEGDGAIPVVSSIFNPADNAAWTIATQVGPAMDDFGEPVFGPRQGDSFLVISSGTVPAPDDAGVLIPAIIDPDANGNSDNGPPPAPIAWPVNVNDLLWMQVTIDVPDDVSGFTLDAAFFTEEFPEYVGSAFNDALVVWAQSGPYDDNLCVGGNDICTATGLWPTVYQSGSDELLDTGFENDGGTGWFTMHGPVEPGGTLLLTIAIFDAGDEILSSVALLDAFRWECEGCDPNLMPSNCGF